jgi:hypothetical protein
MCSQVKFLSGKLSINALLFGVRNNPTIVKKSGQNAKQRNFWRQGLKIGIVHVSIRQNALQDSPNGQTNKNGACLTSDFRNVRVFDHSVKEHQNSQSKQAEKGRNDWWYLNHFDF